MRQGIRLKFRFLDYLIGHFDRITSQVPHSESSRRCIESAADEVLDMIAGEVQRLARAGRKETVH